MNVIWLFGDQHRGQALGCAGDPNVHTPNIDSLAATGVRFPNAVAGSPLCCPFRGSLLTGRYPHRAVPGHQRAIPAGQETVARPFRDAGYHTAYIGKWHLAGFQEKDGRASHYIIPPTERGGFDKWIGYENNNSQRDCWVHGGVGDEAFHHRLPGFETDSLTDLFIDHLRERAAEPDRPFFASLSIQPPHDPYIAPEHWMGRHTPGRIEFRPNVPAIPRVRARAANSLAGYYALIENWDWNVGRIQAALRETGLLDNTIVVFFSDHGDMHGSHGQFLKTSPYEESLRVPFIITGGVPFYDRIRPALRDHVINHVDIAPTSLGLCGIAVPDWMDGTDYSHACVRGGTPGELPGSAFLQLVEPVPHPDSIDRPWRGVVTTDGWKYAVLEEQPWLMFNLAEDPHEQANLAHNLAYREKRHELQAELAGWIERTGDTFPLPAL